MTSRKFIIITLIIYAFIAAVIITFNYISDDFGLFRSHESRRIWGREKTSKYLMAFKYIPENFDAVLVGSSVSANMDTSKLEGYKVYNLSMNSGNMTELKYPLDVLIETGKIKVVIFCLYYYTTKDNGVKGNQLSEKEYWGSLYSVMPFEILKYKVKYGMLKKGFDVFSESDNGFNNFNIAKRNVKFDAVSKNYMEDPKRDIFIDDTAFEELKMTVSFLHKKDIKVIGYFYPIYREWFEIFQGNGEWDRYKNKILSVFDPEKDMIVDMNTEDFLFITSSEESYSDGHLSDKGSEQVINELNRLILKSNGTK